MEWYWYVVGVVIVLWCFLLLWLINRDDPIWKDLHAEDPGGAGSRDEDLEAGPIDGCYDMDDDGVDGAGLLLNGSASSSPSPEPREYPGHVSRGQSVRLEFMWPVEREVAERSGCPHIGPKWSKVVGLRHAIVITDRWGEDADVLCWDCLVAAGKDMSWDLV